MRAHGMLMRTAKECQQAWAAFLRLPPRQATFLALSGSLVVGGVLLAGTEILPGRDERLQRSREEAARIPRLRQAEMDARAAEQRAALHAMIAETKTKTLSEKLSTASTALYSFHTGRAPPEDAEPTADGDSRAAGSLSPEQTRDLIKRVTGDDKG